MRRFAALASLCAFLFFATPSVNALSLRHGAIVVEYDASEEALAHETLGILSRSVDEFAPHLPVGTKPIHVIVCDTQQEFARNAQGYTMRAVLGIAYPEQGVIVLKAPELAEGPKDYKGTVRHELVHVLLARNVDMAHVPRWLNEGIAMVLSGEHRYESTARIAQMYLSGKLIEYRNLELVFLSPGRELEFGDAYAQSLSMTRHLSRLLGEDGFWEFVRSLKTQSFGLALKDRLGMDVNGYFEAWKRSLWKFALVFSLVSGFSIFQVMALLTFVAYLRKRRRGQRLMRVWEREEAELFGDSSDDGEPNDPESGDEECLSCSEYEEDEDEVR